MKKLLLVCLPFIFGFGFLILIAVFAMAGTKQETEKNTNTNVSLVDISEEVYAYQPLVEKYASEYEISDYVPFLLAIMQVESGGKGNDVMQSSESAGKPLNSLTAEESIKQACKYFSELVALAKKYGCDTNSILQAYNFGASFLSYCSSKNGGIYSYDTAESFANQKAKGIKVTYSNAISLPINGGWRYKYGNQFYVLLLNQYLVYSDNSSSGEFIYPIDGAIKVTSLFGGRIHPITGVAEYHLGIDMHASFGVPVKATMSGTVTVATYHYSYGNYVMVDHGNGYKTLYAHMSSISVSVGQSVTQGQEVGKIGSTGSSTAPHCHYEVWLDGQRTDPLNYYDSSSYTII